MLLRTLTTGLILTAGAFAQLSSFPKPNYFRETFAKAQTKVELAPPVKLRDFVVGDKLELSLKNYLELVAANNTDIQLQKLTIEAPKNAIQRAFGAWDPRATAQFTNTRSVTPADSIVDAAGNPVLSGGSHKQLSQPLSVSVTQTLSTGTSYTASFSGSKNSYNDLRSGYNPAIASGLTINFTQPLLQNRGTYVNHLTVMTSRSALRVADYNMRNSIMNFVSTAENAYWDVINARESLRVAESGEATAVAFLDLQQRQLDLGALSPLDIYLPQQRVAQRKVDTSQARFRLAATEDALRKQIGADLDPDVRKLPVVLTEPVDVNVDSLQVDREQTLDKAMTNRFDLKSAVQNLDIDDLRIQQSRNALLPNLSLIGNYTSNGRGGVFFPRLTPTQIAGGVPLVEPGGLSDAFGQLFGFGFTSYQFGLRLTFPIRSKAASADMADAVVRKRQDTLFIRSTQQAIRLGILNALTNLESTKEAVQLAKVSLDFADKNLAAANQKYSLGTALQLDVSNAQDAKVQAESAVVTNQIQLRRNLINMLIQTGTLLDERGIVVQ